MHKFREAIVLYEPTTTENINTNKCYSECMFVSGLQMEEGFC